MSAPELQQACLELALEIANGPQLFLKNGEPSEAVERYTGDRSTRKLDRCLVAGALRTLEYSDRAIAKLLKCDVRSIPLMLKEAEDSGRIPALKDRLARWTGVNLERAHIALGESLQRADDGKGELEDSAMIKALSTAVGILTDKHQLLTGSPTENIRVTVDDLRGERDRIEAWAKSLAIDLETIPTDSKSSGNPDNTREIAAFSPMGYTADTSGPVAPSPLPMAPIDQPEDSPAKLPGGGMPTPTEGAGGDRSTAL